MWNAVEKHLVEPNRYVHLLVPFWCLLQPYATPQATGGIPAERRKKKRLTSCRPLHCCLLGALGTHFPSVRSEKYFLVVPPWSTPKKKASKKMEEE